MITDERPAYWSLGGGGVVIVRNVYTSGTTWNKDANLLYAEVEVQGGGGGSGGTSSASNLGSGGSSGGYARKIIAAASLGSTETVTIGAAGTAGGAGGTTSFGAHVSATSGGKGLGSGTATPKVSDMPGIGSGGDVNLRGEQAWLANTNIGGAGADSYMGLNGQGLAFYALGINAVNIALRAMTTTAVGQKR